MTGLEYLGKDILHDLWDGLDKTLHEEMRGFPGGPQAYLRTRNPIWNLVGRVWFHLAENRRDPENPFAFLATYTSRVSKQARPQYLPLGKALQEYAGGSKQEGAALPAQPGATGGRDERPRPGPGRLGRDLPPAGLDAPRGLPVPQGRPGIRGERRSWCGCPTGGRETAPAPRRRDDRRHRKSEKFGLEALLDFYGRPGPEGEPLTEAEWRFDGRRDPGLVLLRGQWVEVDREKLTEVLDHWKKLEAAHRKGAVVHRGDAPPGGRPALDEGEEPLPRRSAPMVVRRAGEWLGEILAKLRDPARLGSK